MISSMSSFVSKRKFLLLGLATCALALELLPPAMPAAEAQLPDFLVSMFRRRPSRRMIGLGGRGEGFCFFSPPLDRADTRRMAMVWHDRPAFVWQGNMEWIEIRLADSTSPGQRLDLAQADSNASVRTVTLREALPDETAVTIHAAPLPETLQPGETYSFVVKPFRVEAFLPVQFQVMPTPERERITAELQALATQGGTAEEIAVRQANYFAERELWADFWQTLLTVEQPSAELKAVLADEIDVICNTGG